jgi:hypothetical protein
VGDTRQHTVTLDLHYQLRLQHPSEFRNAGRPNETLPHGGKRSTGQVVKRPSDSAGGIVDCVVRFVTGGTHRPDAGDHVHVVAPSIRKQIAVSKPGTELRIDGPVAYNRLAVPLKCQYADPAPSCDSIVNATH